VPQGSDYRAAVVKDARLVDVLTDSFARELATVLDLLKTRIRFLVRQLQAQDGRVIANQNNLALALRLRSDLIAALEQAGYSRLALNAVDDPLDRLAASVVKGAPARVALGAYDVDAIAAMKELRLAQLLQVGEDVAVQLWRVTLDGVLGTRPVLDLVDDIADALDISERQARTLYDTLASTFSRQVAQIGTTGEPTEAFVYVGPDDAKTRDFCAERVDKVFSRQAIENMDNGQLPNAMLTGGGYNCRHQFRRVSKLDAELLDLMDTDTRYQDRKAAA
jgi:hypothetical protein